MQQETLTFPTLQGSPPRFSFPELHYIEQNYSACCSELSSNTSTPFVSAPSSPTSRSRGFYFSAPTSPSWPPRSHQQQGFDFPSWSPKPPPELSSSTSPPSQALDFPYLPLHTHQPGSPPNSALPSRDSPCESINTRAQQALHLQSSGYVKGDRICSQDTEHQGISSNCPSKTEHLGSSHGSHSSLQADHTSSFNWAQQSLQAEHNSRSSWYQKSLQSTQHQRTSSWAPQSLGTEHNRRISPLPQKSHQSEYERSPNWAQPSLETEFTSSSSSSQKSLPSHHGRSPSWTQQKSLQTAPWSQKDLQTEHGRNPLGSQASLQIKDSHATSSTLTQNPHPIITDFASRKALKRLQVEDSDASYSRKSFYASAIPFSWEEKPGTPKARSITSEASNGEDDSPSNLLSGSSEFEFSARFSELEDPPMSPTPIASTFTSFKQQNAYGSPSPTHKYTHSDMQSETVNEEHIWPLRPPPRLDNPSLQKQYIKDEANELKHSYGSLASLSAPQSPRSPRIFDIRGALCGFSSPVDAVFDPFLTAMEKSMAKNRDDLANEEKGRSLKKKSNTHSHRHHRRTQSLSPLRVFHWDDHSAKSNSSSHGSSSMDEVKNKHPIQREINARHSVGTPKGSKRWSFRNFLHRKSISGGESARHSNTSASLRSSGRESCSSSRNGEVMDVTSVDDNTKMRGTNSSINNNPGMLPSMPSTPSILSPSSSSNSSKGKPNTNKANKGPYALHYSMQRAHTEELKKKTFLPYKQGLLGCLGLSSKSYRALATLSKPLQSVS